MKNLLISLATTCIMFSACSEQKTVQNPFFTEWNTPFGIPPFEQIDAAHYLPAFQEGLARHAAEIDSIANQSAKPTFKNTIEALDFSGALLRKVSGVFYNLTDAETNDSLQNIAKEISPLLSEHDDNIYMNDQLFQRVKTIYDNQDTENLTPEQKRVLDLYYKNFVRSGALLDAEKKEQLKQINKDLALLQLEFDENVLAETNNYALIIDRKEDLSGLPQGVLMQLQKQQKRKD